MANWCENTVEITGSKEDIAALKEWMGDFDFNKIIPRPKELDSGGVYRTAGNTGVVVNKKSKIFHRVGSGHAKMEGMEQVTWSMNKEHSAAKAINDGFKPCKVCMVNPRQKRQAYDKPLEVGAALVKKYGFDNWYDWNIANWGTKWDVSEINSDWGETFVSTFFFTAWSPPEGIYNAIVEKFPNLQVKWHYNEGGNCFSGDFDTGVENDFADPCDCGSCDECLGAEE